MSRAIVRVGDKNNVGAPVLNGDSSVRVNNIPVAVDGSKVAPHGGGPHKRAKCVASVTSIRVRGVPMIFVGDKDSCGHTQIQGSPNSVH